MKKSGLNASVLQWILLSLIILFVAGGVVGVMYMQGLLKSQMESTNKIKVEAENSSTNLIRAQLLKSYLAERQNDVDKAANIVANTVSYQYQDQIVQDITRYAQLSGLRILGFDFPVSRSI